MNVGSGPKVRHYDLEASLNDRPGELEVQARIWFYSEDSPAPSDGAATALAAPFLLSPDLTLLDPTGPAGPAPAAPADRAPAAGSPAERYAVIHPGQKMISLRYQGRLARTSPAGTWELARDDLWYPLFSRHPAPFTFRLLLRVPPEAISAVSGRLVPLPSELSPGKHDHRQPRAYLWESFHPGTDIAVAAGPYLAHQRLVRLSPAPQDWFLPVEVLVLGDDYDLGGHLLVCLERLLTLSSGVPASTRGASLERLGVVVPPVSRWGVYSRPGHIVIPRPVACGLRDPEGSRAVADLLAGELRRLGYQELKEEAHP
jgi:hypothetical protein